MSYSIEFKPSALRQFDKLPLLIQKRIRPIIDALAADPRPKSSSKLEGSDDLHRVRVSDYRIIYQIQDRALLILVVKVAHRREVYRR